MRVTFTLNLPNETGVFAKVADAVFSSGAVIIRSSYSRAIDLHTVFVEVEGAEPNVELAEEKLCELGFTKKQEDGVTLVRFDLNRAEELSAILGVISRYGYDISFLSEQPEGEGFVLRAGLAMGDRDVSSFVSSASRVCKTQVEEYDKSSKTLDNTAFYLSFANGIAEKMGLNSEDKNRVLVNSNLIMQILFDKGVAPHTTFENIEKFADCITRAKQNFKARVTKRKLNSGAEIILIEPPCGSNVCVLNKGKGLVGVDGGYAVFADKTEELLRRELPRWDFDKRTALLTHADDDHCGMIDKFDEVLMCQKCYDNFVCEKGGGYGFRKRVPSNAPYVRISAVFTEYKTPNLSKMRVLGGVSQKQTNLLERIGTVQAGGFTFEAYEGIGGHVSGETVFIEREERLVFSGDLFTNMKGFTKEQAEFNEVAPILLTSVDIDPKTAAFVRGAFTKLLGKGEWIIYGGHGAPIEYKL